MSDIGRNGKEAVYCLEHLLYSIHESNLHNTAAILAQETGQSVSNFGKNTGHWTFPVVKRFLFDRGMKCTVASSYGHWTLDSLLTIQSHPGLVGIIDIDTLASFVYKKGTWHSSNGQSFTFENAVVVHKMWTPLLPFYTAGTAFHVTDDNTEWTRSECQPSSCWRVESVSYKDRGKTVKAQMRLHKKSPIMMSNSHEIVICSPAKNGWETETLLNYECMPVEEAAETAAAILIDRLVEHIEHSKKGWPVMAHALFSALQHLNGHIRPCNFTTMTTTESTILEEYTKGLDRKRQKN
jgi:hypothetical protein|tara:strand:- start:1044 stop:1928 length:885 start_codon:yes stop_codon:yes gene_type:complete